MKNLVIEGWRGINHSYALVNQHQLLGLATCPDFAIYHVNAPLPRAGWQSSGSGFDEDDAAIIDAFGPPPQDTAVDVLYRMSFPFRFHGSRAKRTFVFGTAELGRIPPNFIERHAGTDDADRGQPFEIVTPSHWSALGIRNSGYTCPVHVVPHGVDPSLYWPGTKDEKRALRSQLGLPRDGFVFLNIGAMTWNKGTQHLLRAFSVHRKKYKTSCLLLKSADFLYGQHVDDAIREAVSRHGDDMQAALPSVRIIRDNLSNDELACLYRASDAYVSPYLAEAFNIPVLEAIASGLPVITTVGGPTDDFCRDEFALKIESSVVNSEKGQYLEPNIESLIAHMAQVVEDAAFRSSAATAGPAWAQTHYSWRAVTEKLASVLRS